MTRADQSAEHEAQSLSPGERRAYDALVAKGNAPAMAMMFLRRRATPMNGSDQVFQRQRRSLVGGMKPWEQRAATELTAKAGISTTGKFHLSCLGGLNDPKAWVGSRDEALAVAKERRLNLGGLIEHDCGPAPPPKPVKLAPDLVQELTNRKIATDPELQAKVREKKLKRKDVEQQVIDTHGNKHVNG